MKKTVLVTGASRGIGKTTAIEFAKNGYDVAITYFTNKNLAQTVKDEIENLGANCLVMQCDI